MANGDFPFATRHSLFVLQPLFLNPAEIPLMVI